MKLLLVAPLAACLLASCGGDGKGGGAPPPGTREYFEGVQSIQRQANDAAGQIPSLQDVTVADGITDAELATLAEFFDVTRALYDAVTEALRRARPPDAARGEHFAYLDAVVAVRDIALDAQDSLEDRDAIAGALAGLARATTEATAACRDLQGRAVDGGVVVDFHCE